MMAEKRPASSKKIALTPSTTARVIRQVLNTRPLQSNSAVCYHSKIPV